jgi:hypothetical protein
MLRAFPGPSRTASDQCGPAGSGGEAIVFRMPADPPRAPTMGEIAEEKSAGAAEPNMGI